MDRRALLLLCLGGCAADVPAGVEVVVHSNAAVPVGGVAVDAFDIDGERIATEMTDADGVVWLDVPEGGAVGVPSETVTGVSPGDRIVLGPRFRRSSSRSLDLVVEADPPGVTSNTKIAGCGGGVQSFVACPGATAVDVLVLGNGLATTPYAYALDADPDDTITVGPWQSDQTAASLAYVDPLDDDDAFTMRVFAASEWTYAELGVDVLDAEAHTASVSLPTGFLRDTGSWAGLIGGTFTNGWERLRYELVEGAFGDVLIADADLPPRIEDLVVNDRGSEHPSVSWTPPDDVSAFDVLVILDFSAGSGGDAAELLLVLPPGTAPPVTLPRPLALPGDSVYVTYLGHDTVDGYADVKARGYADVSLAAMLDRARAGARTYAWTGE